MLSFTLTMILCRFAKEQNFTLQQISAFFTLLKEMLDNIKGNNCILLIVMDALGSNSTSCLLVTVETTI